MAEQALVQVRVDSDLKKEVSDIYEALGMDLPTAIRMFMKKSKMVRGLPFDTRLPDTEITRAEAMSTFEELRRQAADVPDMTLDEINAEIMAAREERKRANQ